MRTSCNGCRVLRKRCSDSCVLRPCLQWIKSSESQENATVFLAKFYGRSGLLNLINYGPEDSRPTIFRSLLYEACGRLVSPTFGSVGLLLSGKWKICQSAVESILRGSYPFPPYNSYRALSTRLPLRGNRVHSARSEARFRLPASRVTKLSRSCTGAESEDIDGLGSRTFQTVSHEDSWGNGVDGPDEKGNGNDLMRMQAETQIESGDGRIFQRNSCNKLEIKQDITHQTLELELRLGSRECHNSCDPTLSQPP